MKVNHAYLGFSLQTRRTRLYRTKIFRVTDAKFQGKMIFFFCIEIFRLNSKFY
ncbi:hypothetical protein DU19_0911 [Chlamydia muridarum]|nr:hypothetical protein DU17_0913 [Chlamydia muridarum]KDU81853.1 hypothetical protein DU18_0912 [Chlamydia muridarum]KDU82811.1 hypothetical protein DU19_0911 [Chlamydia muridarum]KDU83807.1 hypothetical protein DU20_0911 [Chlamydia muridarum]KDU84305.1 hypothetical protein DU21_0913 [Chlamydia muridarum]